MPTWLTSIGLKIGVAAAVVVLVGALYLDNAKLRAEAKAAQAETAQKVSECQAEAATQAAQESTQAAQAIAAAQAQANDAEAQLQAQRKVLAAAQAEDSAAVTKADSLIDEQALQPALNGPIAPVLEDLFQ